MRFLRIALPAAKREGKYFAEPGGSDLITQSVREFVDGKLGGDGVCLWNRLDDVVVPVSDGHILGDVYGVNDVSASRRN